MEKKELSFSEKFQAAGEELEKEIKDGGAMILIATNGCDDTYFNIIGTEWDTTISNVTFKITMPKEFDASKIGFSVGRYGTSGYPEGYLTYDVDGTTITGSYNYILNSYNINLKIKNDNIS